MSSRLRHHGRPGLHDQKCESTVKTRANPTVTGTIFVIVSPSIVTTKGQIGHGGLI